MSPPVFPRWEHFNGESTQDKGLMRCREVAHNLYVGGYAAMLMRSDWRCILALTSYEPGDRARLRKEYPGVVARCLPFPDGAPVPEVYFDEALALWDAHGATGPVLFHCAQGLSRSASVAYVVLRLRCGLDHEESMRRLVVIPGYPMAQTIQSATRYAIRAEVNHG